MTALHADRQSAARAAPERPEPQLSLVGAASAGERARQRLLEARTLSLEHLAALQSALDQTRALSEAVVQGGDLYGVGLPDFTRRLAEDLLWRGKTLEVLTERQRQAASGR